MHTRSNSREATCGYYLTIPYCIIKSLPAHGRYVNREPIAALEALTLLEELRANRPAEPPLPE